MKPLYRQVLFLALFVAWLLRPAQARANGRFPEANAIFFSDAEPDLVFLRVTFGAIVSRDRGKTWKWSCERAIGSVSVEDPMFAFTPGGRIIASTFQGLSMSQDRACTWTFAGGSLANVVFVDLSEVPSNRKQVVAFASSYDRQDDAGTVMFKSELFETQDEGVSWTALGQPLDPYLLGETVDYAPSDPSRIYVSAIGNIGLQNQNAVVLATSTHGASWSTYPVALEPNERAVFLAGVDPQNPDRVYARTQNAIDRPSRLLVSDDGGKTFRTAFKSVGALLGFALSADGKRMWIGGPLDGVLVADTGDLVFMQKSKQPVQCLKLGVDGLWACGSEKDGFVAGLSRDEGATWEAKLHFCEIRGALDCAAGTSVSNYCAPAWASQSALLGCTSTADSGVDGGSDAGTGAEAGRGTEVLGGGCRCNLENVSLSDRSSWLAFGSLFASIAFVVRRRRA